MMMKYNIEKRIWHILLLSAMVFMISLGCDKSEITDNIASGLSEKGLQQKEKGMQQASLEYEPEDSGPVTEGNLSVGKFYTFSRTPVAEYPDKYPLQWSDGTLLTDEMTGEDNNWADEMYVGWEGQDPVEVTVDLGRVQTLNEAVINGLYDDSRQVVAPADIFIDTKEEEGDAWNDYNGSLAISDRNDVKGEFRITVEGVDRAARYVKLTLTPRPGSPSQLLLLDEISLLGKIKNTWRSVPANGAFHGAYPTYKGFPPEVRGNRGGMTIDLFEEMVGKQISMVLWYQGMSPERNTFGQMQRLRLKRVGEDFDGMRPFMIGWLPYDNATGDHPSTEDIAEGELDEYFTQYFTDAVDESILEGVEAPMFFRPLNEFNGSWAHWGLEPDLFRQAWRRMYNIAEQTGATEQHIFVWSPNSRSAPRSDWNKMQHYYPGDQYVDWVGLSLYSGAVNEFPAEAISEAYDLYADYKPFMVTEGAAKPTNDPVRWTREWFGLKDTHPDVKGLVWYNGPETQLLSKDAEALEVYREEVQDDYWLGEIVEGSDAMQLSFSTWKHFGTYPVDLNQVSVWASTDFDGVYEIDHVRDATWTEITDEFSLPDHKGDPNTPSGTVNLVDHIEDADGEVYIGFKYVYDPSKGIRTIWRLEDFLLNDNWNLTEQPDAGFRIVPGDEALSKTRFASDTRTVLQIDKDAPEPTEDWVITKGF